MILSSIKLTFVRKAIEKLRTGGKTSVTVSRGEARKFVESGKVDHTGRRIYYLWIDFQTIKWQVRLLET